MFFKESTKNEGILSQLTQMRRKVVEQVGINCGDEEPESVFGRHPHEHEPDNHAHSLAVPDLWIVEGIALENLTEMGLSESILFRKELVGWVDMDELEKSDPL